MSKSKLVCPFYSACVERDMHGAQRKLNKESSLQLLQHFSILSLSAVKSTWLGHI